MPPSPNSTQEWQQNFNTKDTSTQLQFCISLGLIIFFMQKVKCKYKHQMKHSTNQKIIY